MQTEHVLVLGCKVGRWVGRKAILQSVWLDEGTKELRKTEQRIDLPDLLGVPCCVEQGETLNLSVLCFSSCLSTQQHFHTIFTPPFPGISAASLHRR